MVVFHFDETDRLSRSLTHSEREAISLLDLQQLHKEREGRSPEAAAQITAPAYGVLSCFRMWELLIVRMEQDWRGTDYHMVDEYLNDLTVRDGIDDFLDAMPKPASARVRSTVERLDDRYREVTIDDGGTELAQYWRPLADGRELRWWWTRRPINLPPGW